MKPFLDQNFLLSNETAMKLYHDYASRMPIVDYHCHINPREIAEDKKYDNITQVWLGGDHYKWRLMRAAGIDEYYITGDAPDYEKFVKWAEVLSKGIGNPLYHWSHLELQRYFDYHGILNKSTAKEVWDICNKKLAESSMSVRNIIRASNVTHICTTDDPVDSLEHHDFIEKDPSFNVKVLPAWRPDKAMNLEKPEFLDYIGRLSSVSGVKINSFSDLKDALIKRMEFFHSKNCRISDHGLDYVAYAPTSDDIIESIFQKRLQSTSLTTFEIIQFKTSFMLFLGKEYHRLGWVMQLHYGTKRNNNLLAYNKLGPDTGYDCINNYAPSSEMVDFFDELNKTNQLPKTIIYSLNPNDNAVIDTIIGSFQDSSTISKIQHGSAWWYNDHKLGMTDQMTSLANIGYLAGFVGMLTDSRSFLSYPRHEYFRRILCDIIGTWVENGEFPQDYETLGEIIEDICYNNAIRYFGFK
ncbi:MAG: glucuronate isomerase [Anaerolineaceae bacterium]|nr:MAG: glucuronate isomerase [Anaerolineaceae bacterium]